jgi:hypothetical protein
VGRRTVGAKDEEEEEVEEEGEEFLFELLKS